MTPLQRTKANALIGQGVQPDALLSPRQLKLFTATQNNPKKKWKDTLGEDFEKAWNACVAIL